MAAFTQLMALLNLATLGDNPVYNPVLWSWMPWMAHFGVDRAPWAGPHWTPKTGFSREEWSLVRDFVIDFIKAGDNHVDRCYFARSLSEGKLLEGRDLLVGRVQDDWEKGDVDKVIETVLESMGITNLNDLHAEVCVTRGSIHTIADLLLGPDAFPQSNALHPLIADWVLDLLKATFDRWRHAHDAKVLIVEGFQHDVYMACRGVSMQGCGPDDLAAYLQTLSTLIGELNLTFDNERQMQLDYYRDLLYVIDACISGNQATGRCIPLHMRHALVNVYTYTPEQRASIIDAYEACGLAIDAASEHVPDSYSDAFDLYTMLRDSTLGIMVGSGVDYIYLEESPEDVADNAPVWQDQEQTAFLFAALTLPHAHN